MMNPLLNISPAATDKPSVDAASAKAEGKKGVFATLMNTLQKHLNPSDKSASGASAGHLNVQHKKVVATDGAVSLVTAQSQEKVTTLLAQGELAKAGKASVADASKTKALIDASKAKPLAEKSVVDGKAVKIEVQSASSQGIAASDVAVAAVVQPEAQPAQASVQTGAKADVAVSSQAEVLAQKPTVMPEQPVVGQQKVVVQETPVKSEVQQQPKVSAESVTTQVQATPVDTQAKVVMASQEAPAKPVIQKQAKVSSESVTPQVQATPVDTQAKVAMAFQETPVKPVVQQQAKASVESTAPQIQATPVDMQAKAVVASQEDPAKPVVQQYVKVSTETVVASQMKTAPVQAATEPMVKTPTTAQGAEKLGHASVSNQAVQVEQAPISTQVSHAAVQTAATASASQPLASGQASNLQPTPAPQQPAQLASQPAALFQNEDTLLNQDKGLGLKSVKLSAEVAQPLAQAHVASTVKTTSPTSMPTVAAQQAVAQMENQTKGGFDTGADNKDDRSPSKSLMGALDGASMRDARPTQQNFAAHMAYRTAQAFMPHEAMSEVARAAKEGMRKLELQLEPASLGKIQITLQMDASKHLQVHMLVDQNQSRQLLEQQLPQLRQALAEQGLNLSGFSMDMNSQQQQQGGRGDAPAFARSSQNLITPELVGADLSHPVMGVNTASNGGINILA